MNLLLTCLGIFMARILDVSLATIRTIMTSTISIFPEAAVPPLPIHLLHLLDYEIDTHTYRICSEEYRNHIEHGSTGIPTCHDSFLSAALLRRSSIYPDEHPLHPAQEPDAHPEHPPPFLFLLTILYITYAE